MLQLLEELADALTAGGVDLGRGFAADEGGLAPVSGRANTSEPAVALEAEERGCLRHGRGAPCKPGRGETGASWNRTLRAAGLGVAEVARGAAPTSSNETGTLHPVSEIV